MLSGSSKNDHSDGYVKNSDPRSWCPKLWLWMVNDLHVRSVLDVDRCEGQAAKFFKDIGCEVLGLEDPQKIFVENLMQGSVIRHDFSREAYIPKRTFDVIWGCYSLEQIEEKDLVNVLETFKFANKFIFIAPQKLLDRGTERSSYLRSSSLWIKRLENIGFCCDVQLTQQARIISLEDFSGINYFAQSGLVFKRVDLQKLKHPSSITMKIEVRSVIKAFLINALVRTSRAYRNRDSKIRKNAGFKF